MVRKVKFQFSNPNGILLEFENWNLRFDQLLPIIEVKLFNIFMRLLAVWVCSHAGAKSDHGDQDDKRE